MIPLFAKAVELLCTIPGVQQRTAESVIAEIGTDMSRFPSDRHIASWAGQCPGNDRSGTTRHGSKWLDSALTEAAMAATRTNDVYLAAQYQRLRPRRGHGRALGAVKHSIITGCWHMLTTGELYREASVNPDSRSSGQRSASISGVTLVCATTAVPARRSFETASTPGDESPCRRALMTVTAKVRA